jgi:hypothetical protein
MAIYYDNDTNDYYTMDENGNRCYLTNNEEESEAKTNTGKDTATDTEEDVYADVNE